MTKRVVCALLLLTFAVSAQDELVSAGGKWTRSEEPNPLDGKKVVMFRLKADEAELGREPEIQIMCNGDGKLIHARYFMDTTVRLNTDDTMNYNVPALILTLRIDKKSYKPLWDGLDPHGIEIDNKSMKRILAGADVQVRYLDTNYNNLVDEYSPHGLDKDAVQRACGVHGWW